MIPWDYMLQSLVNQAVKRSEQLQDSLEELESRRFASADAPLFLIHLLLTFNERISELLMEFSQENLTDSIDYSRYEDVIDEVKTYASLIAFLYQYDYFLEASHVESNPPGIISAIQRIGQTIVPKVPILICPSFRCSYEYHNLLSKDNLRSDKFVPRIFDGSFFENKQYFPVFLYPLVLQNDALCHVLLMHEVGHLFTEVNGLLGKVVRSLTRQIPEGITNEHLRTFLSEYIADIVAVYVLGPCFLFSLIEFHSTIAGPTQLLPEHPPLLLRIRNILDTLHAYEQRFKAFTNTNDLAKDIEEYLDELDRLTDLKSVPVKEEPVKVYKYIEPALYRARDTIDETISASLKFCPSLELFTTYVDWVKRGIPPSACKKGDKVEPLGFGELLNAAWLYQVANLQCQAQLPSPLRGSKYSANLRDISRLAQIAVQQNEALNFYKEAGII